MSDLLLVLLRMNLAAAAAVVVVLVLRLPARRLFGARIAYGLWLLVPLAAFAMLLPARVVAVRVPATAQAAEPAGVAGATAAVGGSPMLDPWPLLMAVWIAGALASVGWLAWRQAQFGRAVDDGLAGPAVVGVLKPRIVTPSDFGQRYTPREQFVVLAHEQTHIARQDSRINALVALARCLNWFNPLLHVLARSLRVDQELACDAQVVAAHPTVRRSYAEAMLKAQLAARPLPLGCYWLAASPHPLAERIQLLSRRAPDRAEQALGVALLAALACAAVGSAWASKPAQVMFIEAPAPSAAIPRVSHTPQSAAEPERPARPPKAAAAGPAIVLSEPVAGLTVVIAEVQSDVLAAPAIPESERLHPVFENPPRLPRERQVHALANRSSVEPGWAVRVVAMAVDPEGRALMADLTSFGSQRRYRTGSFINSGSRQGVFTSVVQRGERLWVTASLDRRFQAPEVGTVELRSGETHSLALPNGQVVTVSATLRPETPEEIAEARDDRARFRERCRREAC